MTAVPSLRLSQFLVIATELFALLFITHLCTTLEPYTPEKKCVENSAVSDDLIQTLVHLFSQEVVNDTNQAHAIKNPSTHAVVERNLSAKFVVQRRFCVSVTWEDWKELPQLNTETPKQMVILFLAVLTIAAVADFIAALIFFWEDGQAASRRDWITKCVGVCQNLVQLAELLFCVYMYCNWDKLWSNAPFIPTMGPNFFVVFVSHDMLKYMFQIMICLSFVLSVTDLFVISPKVDVIRSNSPSTSQTKIDFSPVFGRN